MKTNNLTYQKALDELNKIISDIESEKVLLDDLSEKVKRAGELLEFCRHKLKETEESCEDTLKIVQE